MSRVFVPQHIGRRNRKNGEWEKHDISPALAFGRIEVLLTYYGTDPALAPQPMITDLRRALRDYRPEDYFLPMGSPGAIAASAAIAAQHAAGRLNVLVWDRAERKYYVSEMKL